MIVSQDKKYQIHPEMVPISSINPLFKYVSPPRQVMLGGNLTQTLVVDGATRKRIRSGFEREHAKGTFKHMFDKDVVILAVIPRFPATMLPKHAENPMTLVIYEDYETKQLGCVELTKFHVMHQHYGFNYRYDEDVVDKLEPGRRFSSGTVIANSPNVTPDGDYKLGLETNVAYITDASVSEDGVVISDEYARRISTHGFETRTFSCGRTHYPISLYGNGDVYKCIPDIGDIIHSNGMIAAFRPFDPVLDPIYMTGRKLLEPTFGMDIPLYGIAGAKVVDIRVLHNEQYADRNRALPTEFTDQLRKYHEADKEFYLKVLKATVARKGKVDENTDLHPDLWRIVYEAITYLGTDLVKHGLWPDSNAEVLKRQRVYRGEQLDEWRVDITFEYTTEVAEGPKLTNLCGSKGVTVSVRPKADMPTDEFGNVADVAMFGGSTVGRMTTGQMHEQALGAAGRDVIKRMRRMLGVGDFDQVTVEDMLALVKRNTSVAKECFEYLLGYYEIVATDTDYPRAAKMVNSDRWMRHLAHVLEYGNTGHGLYIHINVGSDTVKMAEVIDKLSKGPYKPEMSRLRYRNPGDEDFTYTVSENNLIGPTYFLPLEKTATDYSGVSSCKVGHFGTTTRLTQQDKYTRPGRETSTRTTGEDEIRNLIKTVGAHHIADINDLHNNPMVHKEACRNILEAEFPTNIDRVVDREKYPIGGHRPLAYAHHILTCSGKGFRRP